MSDPAYAIDENELAPLTPNIEEALNNMRPVPRISIQAFCETEGVSKPIDRAKKDRRMARAQVKSHMGGLPAAVEFYSSAPTPNLVIVESTLPPTELFSALSGLAEVCDPSSKVVIIGHYNDVGLYRDLTRAGIAEYLVAPVSMADILGVISQTFVDPDAPPLGRSYAFIGAKGGVGASTIAHNIAWSIASLFKTETLLADLDLPFGTANIDFDQDPEKGIAEALFSKESIDEVLLDRLMTECGQHLSMLSAPATLERAYDFDGEAFTNVLEVAQRNTPAVVLDVPHVWNEWTRKILAQADAVIIVASPDLANLRNTKNLLDALALLRPNDKAPMLVINQHGVPKRPEIALKDFTTPLGVTPIATIPFEPTLFGNAANNGQMVGETEPSHAVSQMFTEMAHIITGRTEVKSAKKTGLQSLLGRLAKKD